MTFKHWRIEGGTRNASPLVVLILSISCSFWGNLAKSYVEIPGGLAPPPRGNPGSATVKPSVLAPQKTAKITKLKLLKFRSLNFIIFTVVSYLTSFFSIRPTKSTKSDRCGNMKGTMHTDVIKVL